LVNKSEILISSVITIIEEPFTAKLPALIPSCTKRDGFRRLSDVHLLQKVYDYVLEHLDAPLPTLKELSRIFGTNENKLKSGFKHLFDTSIHQLYNKERLGKAHILIQYTSIPLKKVAFMCGFLSYPNFSKTFKKHFGFSTYELKRNKVDFTPPEED
jgi:AraC-like DNA-binding protein